MSLFPIFFSSRLCIPDSLFSALTISVCPNLTLLSLFSIFLYFQRCFPWGHSFTAGKYNPRCCCLGRSPSFSAPHKTVVSPDECQSKPTTHPRDWNQKGSDIRLKISSGPYSSTTTSTMAVLSLTIRSKSQRGQWWPCSGRLAMPVLTIGSPGLLYNKHVFF